MQPSESGGIDDISFRNDDQDKEMRCCDEYRNNDHGANFKWNLLELTGMMVEKNVDICYFRYYILQ